jgi:hypothetical protein
VRAPAPMTVPFKKFLLLRFGSFFIFEFSSFPYMTPD